MGRHEPLLGNGLYDVLVAAPERLDPARFANAGLHVGEGVMTLAGILDATEAQMLGVEGPTAQAINVRAFTAAQETAYVSTEDDIASKVVGEHIPAQRRLLRPTFDGLRRRLRSGGSVYTSDLAALLNLQHPDYVSDQGLGLVIRPLSFVDRRGRPLPDARQMRTEYSTAAAANAHAFRGYIERRPWAWAGGRYAEDDAQMLSVIMESELWRGRGWIDGPHITPELRLARAERLVRSVEALGSVVGRAGGLLQRLAIRELPVEAKESYRAARAILDTPDGRAFRQKRQEHRRQLPLSPH
jgi:hypothetical protein